jgi:DNA modification methylase
MSEKFLSDAIELHCGDCLVVLDGIADSSIDSCVTDPPYHLTSIVKRFGSATSDDVYRNAELRKTFNQGKSPFARTATGFMGKQWDGGDIAFRSEIWAKVYRVLKPGGHLIAFGGTRTYHRMACAIEDAGFEIRDQLAWVYGSGFPKSHDVSKGIDKADGAKREKIATGNAVKRMIPGADQNKSGWLKDSGREYQPGIELPATDAARQWQGWGTALKPAWEPIVLARKPLIGTVVENVLAHGTGAINIDGCRVGTDGGTRGCDAGPSNGIFGNGLNGSFGNPVLGLGRWPANFVHDGSDEVVGMFPEAGVIHTPARRGVSFFGKYAGQENIEECRFEKGKGTAARFFYTAKADSNDRLGSKHPTVKPVNLMQWLVRLVTPKGGVVLDPFAGTGATGEAAWREGMRAVLIEREVEYQNDIRRRMGLCLAGPAERTAAKTKQEENPGPLFG